MFERNKKIDSKMRFQRRAFRDQLDQARNYKRGRRDLPEPSENRFWQLLSMGSFWVKVFILLFIVALVYVIYVPNLFYLKKVSVEGLDQQKTQNADLILAQYLSSQKLFPQNNLLLLSDQKLRSYFLTQDKDILMVDSIKKDWFKRSLIVNARARQQEFLIRDPSGLYSLSNDGFLTAMPSTTASSSLPRIDIKTTDIVHEGDRFANNDQLSAIRLLQQQLPQLSNDPVDHYEIADNHQPDITVYTRSGVRILFDYKDTDLSGTLEKFHLLITSIAPQDLSHLVYVDMRIKNRSYVCLQNLACARSPDLSIPGTNSSSTPTSTASSTLDNLP